MNHNAKSRPSVSRTSSLALVGVAYAMALVAGWITLLFAPIEDPILLTLAADIVATLVIFGWSMAYDNSSFYDAYWSVIPIAIVLYWIQIAAPGAQAIRMSLMFFVVFVWGYRLTFNWARGWTGLDHEDWRYVGFRERFPSFYWPISFGGIHFFPTLIVYAGLVAAWPVFSLDSRAVGWIDALALATGIAGITFEWLADRQLRAFVTGPKEAGETLRTGLWRYSRHPNYLGEVLIWWSFYLFGLAANPSWAKWAIAAPLAMTGMFLFVSIPLLEKRSLARRPGYQRVIDETSMLIPLPPRTKRATG
jgi:steroid 5-alpha reductase family enzyme